MPNLLKGWILLIVVSFLACNTQEENSNTAATDFCEAIHSAPNAAPLNEALKPLEDSMKRKTGVYVLEEGEAAMISRAWLCEQAQKSIDIQYFIFSTDNIGLIACDYLIRAADRGVKVRILVDDILLDASLEDIKKFDSHKNIELKIYNPGVNLNKNIFQKIKHFATDFRSANQRMHNKTFTVDNKIVITGGRNIADEYFDYDHQYNFRDRDVLLLGKNVRDVQASFEEFWSHPISVPLDKIIGNTPSTMIDANFDALHQYACNPENFWPQVRTKIQALPQAFENIQKSGALVWVDAIEYVSDIPGKNNHKKGLEGGGKTSDAIVRLLEQARHSLDIQSPYLITTKESRSVLEQAVKRGVKIRILTNSLASTDNVEAFSGYQRDREALLKTGVEIYEYKPNAAIRKKIMRSGLQEKLNYTPIFGLHAKSMVVDKKITVIGTFNADPRSTHLNTECICIIPSEKISQQVLQGMNEEFKEENAWRTSMEYNPDHEVAVGKRVKSWTRKIVPKNIL